MLTHLFSNKLFLIEQIYREIAKLLAVCVPLAHSTYCATFAAQKNHSTKPKNYVSNHCWHHGL